MNKIETDIKIDFLRYALHELMLPHQYSKEELNWKCDRVVVKSQQILNQYGLPQTEPERIVLLRNEPYFLAEKDEEIAKLNNIINRYNKFFKFLSSIGINTK